jgi:lambda family phage portal protein
MLKPRLDQNWLDKGIAYVAPTWAKSRAVSRIALSAMGGYNGARTDTARTSNWSTQAGSPTTDAVRDLPHLRARSRDQMRNAPVAVGALNTNVSHTIGTGLAFSAQIDHIALGIDKADAEAWSADATRRFGAWCYSKHSSLDQKTNFFQSQELTYRSWHESGDVFVLTPEVPMAGKVRLALQIIEGDYVCNPGSAADTAELIAGVKVETATGRALGFHFADKHPGEWPSPKQWQYRPALGSTTQRRNVLHIFKPLRPGQVRGMPWIAPIIEPLKQLQRWSDAELNAAVTSSIFSVFIKMDPEAFGSIFDDDGQQAIVQNASKWSGEMQDGQAINLLPGESIETPNIGRPNPAFDPFWTAMVRQMGMALEMPYEVLVMHFQSSYSAARAALLMGWKFFRTRRDFFVAEFCAPVYELWLLTEIAQGRINAPGFLAGDLDVRAAWCAGTWTGDGPGSIDPAKEVQAARGRVELGISTLDAESVLHDGIPWAQKHQQRKRELDQQRADDVPIAWPANQSMPQQNTKPEAPNASSQDVLA